MNSIQYLPSVYVASLIVGNCFLIDTHPLIIVGSTLAISLRISRITSAVISSLRTRPPNPHNPGLFGYTAPAG